MRNLWSVYYRIPEIVDTPPSLFLNDYTQREQIMSTRLGCPTFLVGGVVCDGNCSIHPPSYDPLCVGQLMTSLERPFKCVIPRHIHLRIVSNNL